MNKKILFLMITLAFASHASAQNETDWELQHLMSVVSTLRQPTSRNYNKALESFKKDSLWTIMDEAERHDNENWLIGDRQFKLNRIMSQCSGYDKKMVSGEFLNGNDPNFDYSLTERGIKKNCSVCYELSHREGRQTFVIMPYEKNEDKIELQVFLNNKATGTSRVDNEGNIILSINENVKATDTIKLVVTNKSDSDMPVVIINHNTRK